MQNVISLLQNFDVFEASQFSQITSVGSGALDILGKVSLLLFSISLTVRIFELTLPKHYLMLNMILSKKDSFADDSRISISVLVY